ncbi:MAG: hypothetical protein RI910_2673 [Verrucomicrobiota bacterium]
MNKILSKLSSLAAVASILLLCGCASSTVSNYKPGAYANIKAWQVKLAYESGEVSTTVKDGKVAEVKVARSGNSSTELTLREDLFYYLKDIRAINVSPTGDGVILVSIDGHFRSGGIVGVTVRLTDSAGEVISRMKIKNGDRNATFKDDESFTRFVGDSIIDEIASVK